MPTAFLSHSSRDKDIVGRVFNELGASSTHYDEATFEAGERSASEIYAALSRTDLFVLFASHESIDSRWVQSELALGQQKVFGGQIRRVIVFLLHDLTPEHLPLWLRDHVYQRVSNAKLIAKVIRSKLLDIAVDSGSEFQLFVGRDRELALLKATLAKVSSATPDVIFLAGIEGIGRRSLVRKAFQDTYPWLSKVPVEIVLAGLQGEIEFYKELLAYGPPTSVERLISIVKNFADLSAEQRTVSIVQLLESIAEQKQTIVLKGHESIIKDDGHLQEWVRDLIRKLGKHPYPQLTLISRRMVPAGKQLAYGNVHFVSVQSLSRDNTRDLLSLWLKQLAVNFPGSLVEEMVDPVLGHPKSTEIAARYAAEVGVARIEADRAEFLDMIRQRAESMIDNIPLSEDQKRFIALFQEYEYLSADDILTAAEIGDASVESVLGYLQDHGIIEKDGRYLRLAPYLGAAVSRHKWGDSAIRAFVDRVQQRFVERVNTLQTDEFTEISTIDKAVLSALRTGKPINPVFSRVLLPSQQLRVAREFYDEQNYERAAELCESALGRRHLLTSEAQIEAIRLRAAALARRGADEKFYECLEEFHKYDERVAKRNERYLRGFKLRLDGRTDEAERCFREAYRMGGERNFHVLRELAQILLQRGELTEAERHARVAFSIAPRNAYVIDNLLDILIEKDRDNPRALTDSADVKRLFALLQESAKREEKSFYESQMAHFYSVLKNPGESLVWAEKAVKVTPNLIPVRAVQIRALLAADRLQEADDKINQLRRDLPSLASSGQRSHLFELDRLRVKLAVARGQFGEAKLVLDRAAQMPRKIKQLLTRDVAQAIAYSGYTDSKLVGWANDILSSEN